MAIFDKVSLKMGAGYNLISKDDWLKMPLQDRVDLLSTGRVQFLQGDQVVPAHDALRSLRASTAGA